MAKRNFNLLIFVLTSFFLIPSLLFSQVDTAWVRRYNGIGNWADVATAITVDNNGNVYVTGYSWGGSARSSDYLTIKYDTSGNELWVQRYQGPYSSVDTARAVVVDNSGNIYVTGHVAGELTTIKYDSEGNGIWIRRYTFLSFATGMAIYKSNLYVIGYCESDSGYDFLTLKYDTAGNSLWRRKYNGLGNRDDFAWAIAVDSQGNVYITGGSSGSGTSLDIATIKYDSLGNEVWVRRYNGPGNGDDEAYAIACDNQGNIYVTGKSYGSGTSFDYVTIKYDSDGNEKWVRRYNGGGGDCATAIVVDNMGNVYVTGYSFAYNTEYDYATIKYNSDGNQVWVRRYNGPGNWGDCALAMAIDNYGNIYVTGESWGSGTGYDYATIKYDSNGNLLWIQRYNGPRNSGDFATAITVDKKGNVYVTGGSIGSATIDDYDYATIKYIQQPAINEEKSLKIEKSILKKINKIYDITGKLVGERNLKKGIYFQKDEKGKQKILILK